MRFWLIILGLVYLVSPVDLFSDFFIGWGWLDDLLILWLLWHFLLKNWISDRSAGNPDGHRSDERFEQQRSDSAAGQPPRPADPFAVLGVRPGAPAEDIKAAYRRLVNRYHPDKLQHLGEEFRQLAEKKFKDIQSAYQSLKDAGQV
jgi:DnaJ like chaperone protein